MDPPLPVVSSSVVPVLFLTLKLVELVSVPSVMVVDPLSVEIVVSMLIFIKAMVEITKAVKIISMVNFDPKGSATLKTPSLRNSVQFNENFAIVFFKVKNILLLVGRCQVTKQT